MGKMAIEELQAKFDCLIIDYDKACKQRDHYDSSYTRGVWRSLEDMRYIMELEERLGLRHRVMNYEELASPSIAANNNI